MTPKGKMPCRKLSTRPPFISDDMKCSTDRLNPMKVPVAAPIRRNQ